MLRSVVSVLRWLKLALLFSVHWRAANRRAYKMARNKNSIENYFQSSRSCNIFTRLLKLHLRYTSIAWHFRYYVNIYVFSYVSAANDSNSGKSAATGTRPELNIWVWKLLRRLDSIKIMNDNKNLIFRFENNMPMVVQHTPATSFSELRYFGESMECNRNRNANRNEFGNIADNDLYRNNSNNNIAKFGNAPNFRGAVVSIAY